MGLGQCLHHPGCVLHSSPHIWSPAVCLYLDGLQALHLHTPQMKVIFLLLTHTRPASPIPSSAPQARNLEVYLDRSLCHPTSSPRGRAPCFTCWVS